MFGERGEVSGSKVPPKDEGISPRDLSINDWKNLYLSLGL